MLVTDAAVEYTLSSKIDLLEGLEGESPLSIPEASEPAKGLEEEELESSVAPSPTLHERMPGGRHHEHVCHGNMLKNDPSHHS